MPDFNQGYAPRRAENGKFVRMTNAELSALGQDVSASDGRYAVLTYNINESGGSGSSEVGITNVAVPVSGNVNISPNQPVFTQPISAVPILFGDEGVVDAFGRQRVTDPYTIFDSKQLCDNQPILWETQTQGNGFTNYLSADSASQLGVSGAGDFCIRQTYMRFNYQPGKAIFENEPVLTKNGWTKIKDILPGDVVFDGNGELTKVIGTAHQGLRPTYELTFDDGTKVLADEEHEWVTIIRQNSKKEQRRIVSTKQMLDEYGSHPPVFARWRIPASPVLNVPYKEVSIDPYTLGAVLGDGSITQKSITFATEDLEIINNMVCENKIKYSAPYVYGLHGLYKHLVGLNLFGCNSLTKFIPDIYKFNSKEVRLAVLQGLMDTDGYCNKYDGCAYFYSVSKQLVEDVAFLIRSLGGQAKIKKKKTHYLNENGQRIVCNDVYKVSVIMSINPFKLTRKASLWKPRKRITFDRFVHSIEYVGERNTVCIQVESDDHTFLTRDCIVTHNSQAILMTGVIGETVPNVEKRLGYFNTSLTSPYSAERDGIYFENDGVNYNWCISKNGTVNKVPQSAWNIDPMDGTGQSNITLDFTKSQIFNVDFEWLGVGRVRTGFVVDGKIFYTHFFRHSNSIDSVYMRQPNHSCRYEMYSTGGADNSMRHICVSVISEGGVEDTGIVRTASNGASGEVNVGTALEAVVGIRLDKNHPFATVLPYKIAVLNTSTDDVRWVLAFNPGLENEDDIIWDDIDTGCAIEVGYPSTESSLVTSDGLILAEGFFSSDQDAEVEDIESTLRLGVALDGTPDEIWFCAQDVTAGSADIFASINFKQLL